jgi:phage terminase small subunit
VEVKILSPATSWIEVMALTPKQEKFVLEYIACGNASKAYRAAYNCAKMKPQTVHDTAYTLLQHPEIALMIKELRAEALKRNNITVDDLVSELDEFRVIAKEDRNAAAGVNAVMGKGKLLGLVVDRKDITVHGQISAMSDDELSAFIDEVDVDDADYAED